MKVTVKEVQDRRDRKTFIYLPEKIHAGHSGWVPPIYMDECSYFNPRKNRAFSYSDTIILLAFRGEKPAGRIMGVINHRYNEFSGDKAARFGYLETWQDEDVIRTLLNRVEEWARERGIKRIIGPYGFTDQDPEGFLIEGFDSPVTIPGYYNFEWMPEMVEKMGYTKDIDYVVYKIAVPEELPEFYVKIFERAKRKGHFEVVEFTKRKQLKPWIIPVLQLMNECYSGSRIYGYAPLEEDEMISLAKRYLPLLNPRFVKAVKHEDELAAFIVGMPNLADGIRKARGRLLPFGLWKIFREAKKTKQLDLLLGAIKESYRGRGLDVLMGVAMLKSAREAGMKVLDTHHEMETNLKVRAEMERMGGEIHKRFRVYQKML
jgi:GNAT superfamily N-acetyltransferase